MPPEYPSESPGYPATNKHKEFWRDTPWCASRLSRGHVPSVPWYVPSVPGTFCPFSIDLHINQAQMSQVSLGRPEFVPGTPPGHPTAKFLYVIFLYRFSLFIRNPEKGAFARGALRKFVANCAPNLRKSAGISFRTSEQGCAKMSQTCREFENQFRTILCKYPFSNAPFSKFLILVTFELLLILRRFGVCRGAAFPQPEK